MCSIKELLNPFDPKRYAEGLFSLNTFEEMRASSKSKNITIKPFFSWEHNKFKC